MGRILDKCAGRNGYRFHMERYESAMEVVKDCRSREITDSSFHDKSKESLGDWEGVKSYDEALDLLENGYQSTVESLRGAFKATRAGEGTRFSFQNAAVGFAPVVPLALKGVPNSMISMTMKPIKAKVVDIYYDMTNSCGTESKDIIKAGQAMLGAIVEMERQGYRFNLYAVQTYSDEKDCDMLIVKVKSDKQPLDLKRVSFPLTHTAFFRVIGFDWYSRLPGGRYRLAYGHALGYEFKRKQEMDKICETLFGKNAVWFSGKDVLAKDKEYFKEVVENGNCKK